MLKVAPGEIQRLYVQQSATHVAFLSRQLQHAQVRLTRATLALGAYMKARHIGTSQIALQTLVNPSFAALYQAQQTAQGAVRTAKTQLNAAQPTNGLGSVLAVLDAPTGVPAASSKKTLVLDLAIGLILGIMLSAAFVVVATIRDKTLRYPDELPAMTGLPALASFPYKEGGPVRAVPVVASGQATLVESVMTLLSRIDFGSSPEENGQNGRHKAGRPTLLPSVNPAREPEHRNGNSRDDRADFQRDLSEIPAPSSSSEPAVRNGHAIQDEGRRPRIVLPHRPKRRNSATLPAATVEASWPEMYRELYVSLGVAETAGCVIGVTSSTRGEGRTTVALGLASTLAGDLDCDVLLVDADLDNPSLAHELGIPASAGTSGGAAGRGVDPGCKPPGFGTTFRGRRRRERR